MVMIKHNYAGQKFPVTSKKVPSLEFRFVDSNVSKFLHFYYVDFGQTFCEISETGQVTNFIISNLRPTKFGAPLIIEKGLSN